MSRTMDFLDSVCGQIKYKPVHSDVKEELLSHIEEATAAYQKDGEKPELALEKALSSMGKEDEIGKAFNKQYRLPFNCRYGLMIWAAVFTATLYFIYPLLSKMSHGYFVILNSTISILGILLLLAVINCLVLRRSHLKVCFSDIRHITVGFLIGAVFSVGVLFLASAFYRYGYYPYLSSVKILFFNSTTFFGSELRTFGEEFMIWCFCVVIYMFSVKAKSKIRGFSFAKNFDGSGVYYVNANEDFYK